jgi:geranylgeranyl diphosphate synthase type I
MTPSATAALEAPQLRRSPQPLSRALRSDEGMAEVEQLMLSLAGDPAADLAARMVCEHLATGGKRLRARLALAALEVLGGDRRQAAGWAAACELLHNATLIHDDLQDGDTTRRGRPTTWQRFGAAQAVNAGDLLLMLPFLAVERVPAPAEHRFALASAVARQATVTVRGQTAEIALATDAEVDWEGYLGAVEGKTGALFQLPVEGAAILAGHSPAQARALAAGFRGLGVLFQLQDDVLDLYGEKGRGAPGSDLREGKVSSLVVEHLMMHPGDGPWLRALLALPRDRTPELEVQRAMDRFRSAGALRGVLGRIRHEAYGVVSAPELARVPALRALAWELACVALKPIAHLDASDGLGLAALQAEMVVVDARREA